MSYSLEQLTKKVLLAAHPIGSIYLSINDVDPSTLFGGTWERIASGKCLWGSDGTNTNTTIAAGLPNITGSTASNFHASVFGTGSHSAGDTTSKTGALCTFVTQTSNKYAYSGGSYYGGGIQFNASESNPIYGSSSTVQPPALAVSMWKRTE